MSISFKERELTMNFDLHFFLFGIFPYLAIAIFFLGSLIRFDQNPYSWRSKSSQLLRKKQLSWGSNLFHVGILLLLFGHFFGLLTPKELYHAFGLTTSVKQMLAMVSGGAFGIVTFGGLSLLLARRLLDSRIRKNSSFMDIAVLMILYAQLILGLISISYSASHPDGSMMLAWASWAQHIVTFKAGAADFVRESGLVFKLHVLLGLSIFLIFPFTRLVHVWSAPIWYLFRRQYQIVRSKRF